MSIHLDFKEVGISDTSKLNRDVPIPLYFQLEQRLRERIEGGSLRPGDLLPTENELQEAFGVSRGTARKALESLSRAGLIRRERAIGSVVAQPKVQEPFTSLNSYVLALLDQGREVKTRFLPVDDGPVSSEALTALHLEPPGRVHRLARVIYLDGEPMNYAISVLKADAVPDFRLDSLRETGPDQSLYRALRVIYGKVLDSASIRVAPHLVSQKDAQALGVKPGTPAIRRTRVVFDEAGQPFIYEVSVFCHEFEILSHRRDP